MIPEPRGFRPKRQYRTVWMSDIHLGTRGCKAELLVDFLRSFEAETLYLVGDIIDGSSSTIFVGERASKQSPMTTWTGAVTGCVVPPLIAGYDDEEPPVLILTNTGTVADGRTPNNPLGHVEDTNSRHPGGVNFLYADGSVRFLRQNLDPVTWVGLGTRAGGEVPGEF